MHFAYGRTGRLLAFAACLSVAVLSFGGNPVIAADDIFEFDHVLPEITGIIPSFGSAGGGQLVTIQGKGFAGEGFDAWSNKVTLGNVPCRTIPYYTNPDAIVCETLPSKLTGPMPVQVIVDNKWASLCSSQLNGACNFQYEAMYTPFLRHVSPLHGKEGDTITLTGFWSARTATELSVFFGKGNCQAAAGLNEETYDPIHGRIFCKLGRQAGGRLNITVNDRYGMSVYRSNKHMYHPDGRYMFTMVPDIKSVTPKHGSIYGGTLVTIEGNGFSDFAEDNVVTVAGRLPCEVVSATFEQIVCRTSGPWNSSWDGLGQYPSGGGITHFRHDQSSASIYNAVVGGDYSSLPKAKVEEVLHEANVPYSTDKPSNTRRLVGLFTPDETGNFRFHVASDDYSSLFLSTDEDPANKQRIAFMTRHDGTNYFHSGYGKSSSDDIWLVKGRSYYIEAVHYNGNGGDHLSIAYSPPGRPIGRFPNTEYQRIQLNRNPSVSDHGIVRVKLFDTVVEWPWNAQTWQVEKALSVIPEISRVDVGRSSTSSRIYWNLVFRGEDKMLPTKRIISGHYVKHLGCWRDYVQTSGHRNFKHEDTRFYKAYTVQECAQHAIDNDSTFFCMQKGTECAVSPTDYSWQRYRRRGERDYGYRWDCWGTGVGGTSSWDNHNRMDDCYTILPPQTNASRIPEKFHKNIATIEMDDSSVISGTLSQATYRNGHEGLVGTIPLTNLRTIADVPQITLSVKDVPATCLKPTFCDYTYKEKRTPKLDSITPSSGTVGTVITVRGQQIAKSEETFVYIDGVPCKIRSAKNRRAVCVVGDGSVGSHGVRLDVLNYGIADSQGNTFTHTELRVDNFSPATHSLFGGKTLTVTGYGFPADATAVTVTVGGNACVIQSSSLKEITCIVPAHSDTSLQSSSASVNVAVVVSVARAGANAQASQQLTYSPSDTPRVTGVTPSVGSAAGGNTVTIAGSALVGQGDVANNTIVTFGSSQCVGQEGSTVSSLVCVLQPTSPGFQEVGVWTRSAGWGAAQPNVKILTRLHINDIVPRNSSVMGGRTITVMGRGLSPDGAKPAVAVRLPATWYFPSYDVGCEVQSFTDDSIVCVTGKPHYPTTVSGVVAVTVQGFEVPQIRCGNATYSTEAFRWLHPNVPGQGGSSNSTTQSAGSQSTEPLAMRSTIMAGFSSRPSDLSAAGRRLLSRPSSATEFALEQPGRSATLRRQGVDLDNVDPLSPSLEQMQQNTQDGHLYSELSASGQSATPPASPSQAGCGFGYLLEETPIVQSVIPTDVTSGDVITILGQRLGPNPTVKVAGQVCQIIEADQGNITCTVQRLPGTSGRHFVKVHVPRFGHSLGTPTSYVQFRAFLDSVKPSMTGLFGGVTITLEGRGFQGDKETSVFIRTLQATPESVFTSVQGAAVDVPCNIDSITDVRIVCQVGMAEVPLNITHFAQVVVAVDMPSNAALCTEQPSNITDSIYPPRGFEFDGEVSQGVPTTAPAQTAAPGQTTSAPAGGEGGFGGSGEELPADGIDFGGGGFGGFQPPSAPSPSQTSAPSPPPVQQAPPTTQRPMSQLLASGQFNGPPLCGFIFDQLSTTHLIQVTPQRQERNATVHVTVDRVPAGEQPSVWIGSSQCTVESMQPSQGNNTVITCRVSNDARALPAGEHQVDVRWDRSGSAKHPGHPFNFMTVSVVPVINSITPTIGSLGGSQSVTIAGSGLEDVDVVKISSQSCIIKSSTRYQVVCETVSYVNSNSNRGVTVSAKGIAGVCEGTCKFATHTSHTPYVASIAPTQPTNGSTITLTGTGFVDCQSVTAQLERLDGFGGANPRPIPCPVTSCSSTKVTCTVPNAPGGEYRGTVSISTQGKSTFHGSNTKFYVNEVFSTPASINTNLAGGQIVSLTGTGFNSSCSPQDVQVCGVDVQSVVCSYTDIQAVVPSLVPRAISEVIVYSNDASSAYDHHGWLMQNGNNIGRGICWKAGLRSMIGGYSSITSWYSASKTVTLKSVNHDKLTLRAKLYAFDRWQGEAFTVYANGQPIWQREISAHYTHTDCGGYGYSVIDVEATFNHTGNSVEIKWWGGATVSTTAKGFWGVSDITLSAHATDQAFEIDCPVEVKGGWFRRAAGTVRYTAVNTPVINSVRPSRGTTAGGNHITIAGTGFHASGNSSSVAVDIDGKACNVLTASSSQVVCETTAHATALESVVTVKVGSLHSAAARSGDNWFQYVDLWSANTTWGGGPLPGLNDSVVIPAGHTVLLDMSPPLLQLVVVEGSLVFDEEKDIDLNMAYMVILRGKLQVGTEDKPFPRRATITMHGDRHNSPELPHYGAKVIAVRDGTIDLHGMPREPRWTHLAADTIVNSTCVDLAQETDWQVGDQIAIASSARTFAESEQRYINSTFNNGRTVCFQDHLNYLHSGSKRYLSDGTVIDTRAEVALLSRNVVFRGDKNTKRQQFGAHIMMFGKKGTTTGRFSDVEVTNAGQAFNLGRYPIHFHLLGDIKHCYIKRSSIHNTFNRAVAIHGVHFLRVQDNVAYNTMGNTFFVEDAIETNNVITGNLGFGTKPSWALLNVDIIPATFWITRGGNILKNNVAAGSDFFGFWYMMGIFSAHPSGPSFTTKVCPRGEALGVFDNNKAHSNDRYGVFIWPQYDPRERPCESYNAVNNPPVAANLTNVVSYMNGFGGGTTTTTGDIRFINWTVAYNRFHGMEFTETAGKPDTTRIQNAIVVPPEDHVVPGPISIRHHLSNKVLTAHTGLLLPKQDHMIIDNVTFHDYASPNVHAIHTCSHCVSGSHSPTLHFSNIKWINTTNFLFPGFYGIGKGKPDIGNLIDVDGSLTGRAPGSTVTVSWPVNNLMVEPDCFLATEAGWGGQPICKPGVEVRSFKVYHVEPQHELRFKKFNLTDTERGISRIVSYMPKQPWHTTAIIARREYTYSYVHEGRDLDRIYFQWNPLKQTDAIILRHDHKEYRDHYGTRMQTWPYWTRSTPVDEVTFDSDHTVFSYNNSANVSFPIYDERRNGVFRAVMSAKNWWNHWGQHWQAQNMYVWNNRCPVGGCPKPPPPPYIPPENRTRLWSDPSSWPNGRVPAPCQDVTIPSSWNVLVDVSTQIVGKIVLYGNLRIADIGDADAGVDSTPGNITFSFQSIEIRGGNFTVGTRARPFQGRAELVVHGSQTDPIIAYTNALDIGNKAIVNFGTLSMVGKRAQTTIPWSSLGSNANAGDNVITLSTPGYGWRVGDVIAVAPSGYEPREGEDRKITSISQDAKTLTLDKPLKFYHHGSIERVSTISIDERAEVAHLSRNVVFRGHMAKSVCSPRSSKNDRRHGAHIYTSAWKDGEGTTMFGKTDLYGVEFSEVGQFGQERAATTFMNLGPHGRDNKVERCGFRNVFTTNTLMKQSNNVLVKENTIYNTHEMSVLLVQKAVGNQIIRNLAIKCHNPLEHPKDDYPYSVVEATKGNIVHENIAAGIEMAGFRVPADPCGNYDNNNRGEFYGNKAHSSTVGLFLAAQHSCTSIHHFVQYKSWQFGIYAWQRSNVIVSNVAVADNWVGIFGRVHSPGEKFIRDNFFKVQDSLIVGETSNHDCGKIKRPRRVDICSEVGQRQKGRTAIWGANAMLGGTCGGKGTAPSVCSWACNQADPSVNMTTTIHKTVIANFGTDECGKTHNAIRNDAEVSDTCHPKFMSRIFWVNTPFPNRFLMYGPNPKWAIPRDCGTFPCQGPAQCVVTDVDGTALGIAGATVTSNNPSFNPRGSCFYSWYFNGYLCYPGLDQRAFVIESMDGDSKTRSLVPVSVKYRGAHGDDEQDDSALNFLNSCMDKAWLEGYTSHKRMSSFWTVGMNRRVHDIRTTSTPARHFRFSLPSSPPESVLMVRIRSCNPERRDVFVDGRQIEPLTSSQDLSWNLHSGANKMVYDCGGSGGTLSFLVRGGQHAIHVKTVAFVQVSLRVAVTTDDFYDAFDIAGFTANVAYVLGIDPSRIKNVEIVRATGRRLLNAGADVNFNIEEEQQPATTTAAAFVTTPAPSGTTAPGQTAAPDSTNSTVVVEEEQNSGEEAQAAIAGLQSLASNVNQLASSGGLNNALNTTVEEVKVEVPILPPSVPRNTRGSAPSPRTVVVAWDAPEHNGGSAITNYTAQVQVSRDWGNTWQEQSAVVLAGQPLNITFTDLPGGGQVQLNVQAFNKAGKSALSTPAVLVEAQDVPYPPSVQTLASSQDLQLTATWQQGLTSGSPVSNYDVQHRVGSAEWQETASNVQGTSLNLTSMQAGAMVAVRVRARNAIGESDWSTASSQVQVLTVPEQSTQPRAYAGYDLAAQVVWTLATSQGLALSGVHAQIKAATVPAPTLPAGYNATNATLLQDPVYSAALARFNGASLYAAWTDVPSAWVSSPVSGASVPSKLVIPANTLVDGVEYTFRVRVSNAYGWGDWSDASQAFQAALVRPPTAPAPPDSITATAVIPSKMSVQWLQPSVDGGNAIVNYTLCLLSKTGSTQQALPQVAGFSTLECESFTAGAQLTKTFAGLTGGQKYSAAVMASNAIGPSNMAIAKEVTAISQPVPPQVIASTVVVKVGAGARANCSWEPEAFTGLSAASYDVQVTIDGGLNWTSVDRELLEDEWVGDMWVATEHSYGQSVSCRIRVNNAAGTSVWSQLSTAVTLQAPPAPSAPAAPSLRTVPPGGILATWSAPASDPRSPVIKYEVKVSGAALSSEITQLIMGSVESPPSATFMQPGLQGGQQYSFSVRAGNTAGFSGWSTPATLVAASAPLKMQPPSVVNLGAGRMRVAWQVPADTGSAVTRYIVQRRPFDGAFTILNYTQADITSMIVSDHTPGVRYEYTVGAENSLGAGEISDPSLPVMTAVLPSSPSSISVTADGDRSVRIAWPKPHDGWTNITYYTLSIQVNNGAWVEQPRVNGENTLSYALANLQAGSTIRARISATNAIGTSTAHTDSQTAATVFTKPSKPAVTVEARTGRKMIVSIRVVRNWAMALSCAVSHTSNTDVFGTAQAQVHQQTFAISVANLTQSANVAGNDQSVTATTSFIAPMGGSRVVVQVTCTNAAGQSDVAESQTVIAVDRPRQPRNPVVSQSSGLPTLTISWTDGPFSGADITGIEIQIKDASSSFQPVLANRTMLRLSESLVTVSGLVAGRVYQFRLALTNAHGVSDSVETLSTKVFALPGAPSVFLSENTHRVSGPGGKFFDTMVTVNWNASDFGFYSKLHRLVFECSTAMPLASWSRCHTVQTANAGESSGGSFNVTAKASGQLRVRAIAHNALGHSPQSESSRAVSVRACNFRVDCNGNGVCDWDAAASTGCRCNKNRQGEDCMQCSDGYFGPKCHPPTCEAATTCTGNGVCLPTGRCLCNTHQFGLNCSRTVTPKQVKQVAFVPGRRAELQMTSGHKLAIPASSVSSNVSIETHEFDVSSIEVPEAQATMVAQSSMLDLKPDGLQFDTPVDLNIATSAANPAEGTRIAVFVFNTTTGLWDEVAGSSHTNGVASAQLHHFSMYAAMSVPVTVSSSGQTADTKQAPTPGDESSLPIQAMLGIGFGAGALATLSGLSAAFVFMRRRRQLKKRAEQIRIDNKAGAWWRPGSDQAPPRLAMMTPSRASSKYGGDLLEQPIDQQNVGNFPGSLRSPAHAVSAAVDSDDVSVSAAQSRYSRVQALPQLEAATLAGNVSAITGPSPLSADQDKLKGKDGQGSKRPPRLAPLYNTAGPGTRRTVRPGSIRKARLPDDHVANQGQ